MQRLEGGQIWRQHINYFKRSFVSCFHSAFCQLSLESHQLILKWACLQRIASEFDLAINKQLKKNVCRISHVSFRFINVGYRLLQPAFQRPANVHKRLHRITIFIPNTIHQNRIWWGDSDWSTISTFNNHYIIILEIMLCTPVFYFYLCVCVCVKQYM